MEKVFFSHPMSGLTDSEVLDIRKRLFEFYESFVGTAEFDIIDNYNHENVPENAGRMWHLGESIKLMDKADIVIFSSDWYKARGCHIEMTICKRYGKTFIVEGRKHED